MWIRLGSFSVAAGKLADLRTVYYRDCAPIVRSAPGSVDCYLMESADDPQRCVVCTIWQTEEHARAYEASGTAQQVVAKVKGFFAGPPTLRSYHLVRGVVSPTA